ncbi:cytoskeleton-associated protein 2 isoform X2 [Stigmatopora nigra]
MSTNSRNPATSNRNKENSKPGHGLLGLHNKSNFPKSGSAVSVQFKNPVLLRKNDSSKIPSKIPLKNRNVVTNTTGATSSKVVLGIYKGKIVESKIASIWKSSSTAGSRNTTVAPTKPTASSRNTTVAPTKPTAASRNTRVAPTKPTAGSRNPTVAPAKPKIALTTKDTKVKKPPVANTLTRCSWRTLETAEEKGKKQEAWQASKGKTLKRPSMTSVRSVKKETISAKSASKPKQAAQEVPVMVKMETPNMNSTLDLIENSSSELPVVQDEIDSVVVNLCDAMDAMLMPSYKDGLLKSKEGEVSVEDKSAQVVPKNDDIKEKFEDEDVENVPQTDNAYVLKYNIKTTPYLQSVKKTIEGEVQKSGSRRKSNIKDLKYLTPVRRSCRIERKSMHLPAVLQDHDPCLSSLAELGNMDGDCNGYVYRKNTAILLDEVEI